jgi:hypothetical protein
MMVGASTMVPQGIGKVFTLSKFTCSRALQLVHGPSGDDDVGRHERQNLSS